MIQKDKNGTYSKIKLSYGQFGWMATVSYAKCKSALKVKKPHSMATYVKSVTLTW
jgi:hypothetical protein